MPWRWKMLRNFRIIPLTVILIVAAVGKSDNFDSTRQGGDKAMPTPMGSAVWYLLVNSSTLPNYTWPNGTGNVTPAFIALTNNSTVSSISVWTNNTTSRNVVETSGTWSNSGDSTGGVASSSFSSTAVPNNSNVTTWTVLGNGTWIQNGTNSFMNFSQNSSISTSFTNSTLAPTVTSIFLLSNTTATNLTSTATSLIRNSSWANATTPATLFARETKEPPLDQYSSSCRKYGDSELYNRLQDRGGFNQYFMANSPDEVGQLPGFKLHDDPSGFSETFTETFKRIQRSSSLDAESNRMCTGRCKKISLIVKNALDDYDLPITATIDKALARDAYDNVWTNKTNDGVSVTNVPAINGTNNTIRPSQKYGLISGLCRLEHFIPIGQCDQRAEEEYYGLDRLCTTCRGVYKLPQGCFPQFLNAITCNNTDIQCIFDVWTKTSHGVCREKSITFTVMHNLGNEQCQEWRFESVDVPIACQCYLNKSSWLKA